MGETEQLLTGLATVVALGTGAQWLAWRTRLPSILLLLLFGFCAGPSGLALIDPDQLMGDLLFPIASLSVALILFEGGLSLRFSELEGAGGALGRLLLIGAPLSGLMIAGAAYLLLDFSASWSLLLGSILVVTGPTVVGPLLAYIRPIGRVGAVAKWEGIIIDPIGAVLAVLVFEAITSLDPGNFRANMAAAALGMVKTIAAGVLGGGVVAGAMWVALRRYWVPDHLQNPLMLMVVLAAFVTSNHLEHESGLLTVTLMGILLANQKSVPIKHLIEFKENLRVLLISSLFILLAGRLRADDFQDLGGGTVGFVAVLIFLVRPIAVFASTIGSTLNWRERLFLSWLAPRGIVAASVASVFALELGDGGDRLASITFVVIIATVAIYGLTAAPLARRLGLAVSDPQGILIAGAHSVAREIATALREAEVRVMLVDSNRGNVGTANMAGLTTHYANVLSEHTAAQLDLGGIGRFLALTPNDEVNSLAAKHFSELFGRGEVYQLAPERIQSARKETSTEHLHGRFLFDVESTYRRLDQRLAAGHVVKRTGLTDEFDYDDFRAQYGENALPLFVIGETGRVSVCVCGEHPAPKPGQTLISLIDPKQERSTS